jgi:hypothetical protein
MGFNRCKLKDQRRDAAEKESANPRDFAFSFEPNHQ